jgi:hypothetical protein
LLCGKVALNRFSLEKQLNFKHYQNNLAKNYSAAASILSDLELHHAWCGIIRLSNAM